MDDRSATGEPARGRGACADDTATPAMPPQPGVLILLLTASLLPRIIDVCRHDVLWSDSLHYLRAADGLRHGDLHQGLKEFGLNVYPALLALFGRLGFDPIAVGRWWGVLIGSATVLPLWGWFRRQFDDRIALVACLAYALHGKLAAFSPLIMRDATFGFLFALTLYALWRAMETASFRWFLAAGIAFALAVHTRTEGWLLLVAWFGWLIGRAVAGRARRVMLGSLVGLAVLPLAITVINLTWLRAEPHWEMLRSDHWQILTSWWHLRHEASPAPPIVAAQQGDDAPPPAVRRNPSGLELDRKLAGRLIKVYTYVGGLLTLCGLAAAWRLLVRRDIWPLAVMNAAMLVMIHIRYTQAGLDVRYFLPIVLVSLPWMAMGFFAVVGGTERAVSRRIPKLRFGGWIMAAVGLICAAAGLVDDHIAAGRMMHRHVLAGQWIAAKYGPDQPIAENFRSPSLAAYYAQTQCDAGFDIMAPGDTVLPSEIENRQARIVLLWTEDEESLPRIEWAARRITGRLGYRSVPEADLPAGCSGVLVFVRE